MKSFLFTSLLGLSARAYAQMANACFEGVCYAINIPENTASNGEGDIFLQVTAPADLSWAALGQGSSMGGANIFVVYASADGNNVTVSPRLGTGNFEPRFNSDAQITLLEGSGIANGQMTANFKCSSCNTWNGGSMDFSGNSVTWIHAVRTGSPLNSDDTSADLAQHNGPHDAFDWSIANAKGGSSVNPFVQSTTPDGDNPSATQTSTMPGATAPAGNGDVTPIGGGGGSGNSARTKLIAHGVLASLAVVIFMPLGAITLRLLSFAGGIWLHAAIQILGYLLLTAGVGLGIDKAVRDNYLMNHHPIIGLVVFSVLFFQSFGGLLHHIQFKKTGQRAAVSHVHIWLGRLTITLGIINGGLGIKLAGNTTTGQQVAYGVVAGVMWLAWMASAAFGEMKRSKTPVKYDQTARTHDNEANSRESQEKSLGSR